MRAGCASRQFVVEPVHADGGVCLDSFLETGGETVRQIDAYLLAPVVGVACLVGVGSSDEQHARQPCAGISQSATITGLNGHQHLAVGCLLQHLLHLRVTHVRCSTEVQ